VVAFCIWEQTDSAENIEWTEFNPEWIESKKLSTATGRLNES